MSTRLGQAWLRLLPSSLALGECVPWVRRLPVDKALYETQLSTEYAHEVLILSGRLSNSSDFEVPGLDWSNLDDQCLKLVTSASCVYRQYD